MMNSLVTIQYFQDGEVVSETVPAGDLPFIAGDTTYWRQDVLDDAEMERKGALLKAKIAKQLDNPFTKKCAS